MHFNIFKVTTFLQKGDKTTFDYPVAKQYGYMDSLPSPSSDIDRSYNQFLCQEFFVPLWKKTIWTFVAFIAVPFALIILWIKGWFCRFERKVDAIGENKGMDEVIPDSLLSKYTIDRSCWNVDFSLTTKDILYIIKNVFGWKRPYFVLKCILKIANYSASIVRYKPNAFIVHGEMSFCSSLITDYCQRLGIKHINVMHGEKLRYIRDSYFRFDECYVWDQYYIDLFTRQHADERQFIVAVPPSMKVTPGNNKDSKYYADYKYYLAIYNDEEARNIVHSMEFAKREGKTVKYRIHPRCSDLDVLRKYVPEDEIEMPSQVSIIDSLQNVGCVVGSYTTVLLQAYYSGIPIMMDDMAFEDTYNKLEEYGYILISKNVKRLSDFN